MTIPVSTVPQAVAYLQTEIAALVTADPLAQEILVQVGDLSSDLPNDYISIGEVRRIVNRLAFVGGGGQNFLEEQYEIVVVVSSWTGSGANQAQVIMTRAWQLAAYVESAVRTDPSFGNAVQLSYPMAADTLGPVFSEDPAGLMYTITIPIHVEATI